MKRTVIYLILLTVARIGAASGIEWPAGHLLPTLPAPAATIDCIDTSDASRAEVNLFASLQGIVNRSQPRIACVTEGEAEGEFTWLDLHHLSYQMVDGYEAVQKYRSSVAGLVVVDPQLPDTVNLATTIAGVRNELICDPRLLDKLTNAPYRIPIKDDLRGKFQNKYEVYNYLYAHFWKYCTHRIVAGLNPKMQGHLRDYVVAMKIATVWLDPAKSNRLDQVTLRKFTSEMTAARGLYMGWWPSEDHGLNWIYKFGIPVLASDFFCNSSLYGGVRFPIKVPQIPPLPALENKIYLAMILSDGDNIQYMQHAMKLKWQSPLRGTIPIGWTASPLAVDADPGMLDYYWTTATTNDCIVSGPSGAGYTHMQRWRTHDLNAFTKLTEPYLERGGFRIITVWDEVTPEVSKSYSRNCPSLLGVTDEHGGNYTRMDGKLRTVGLTVSYSSKVDEIVEGITNAARQWNGQTPLFIAVQGNVWGIGPKQLREIVDQLDTRNYVLVRPDHLVMLYNKAAELGRVANH